MRNLGERSPALGSVTAWVDLDGTLAEHCGAWRHEKFGKKLPTSLHLLKTLKMRGFRVCIFSARTDTITLDRSPKKAQQNLDEIKQWLYREGLSYFVDDVWAGDKPLGYILDDRAVRWNGDVMDAVGQLEELRDGWKETIRDETVGHNDRTKAGILARFRRACGAAILVWWSEIRSR